MSKKRKTRKEKMRSAIRQSTQVNSVTPVYTIDATATPVVAPRADSPAPVSFTHRQYAYVIHDARQTFIITSILFAAGLALYFTVQNHILSLSFLGY